MKNIQPFLPTSLLFFLISNLSYAHSTDLLREKAIFQIKNGQTTQGLTTLELLLQQYPEQQKILADYLLSASQIQDIPQTTLTHLTQRILPSQFPEYAQLATVKLLRDQKQFADALVLLEKFEPYQKHNELQVSILKSVLFAENKQQVEAVKILKNLDAKPMNAEQLALVAYVYRLLQQNTSALQTIQLAYAQQPTNETIQNEYLNILIALRSYEMATAFSQKHHLTDKIENLTWQTRVGKFSQNINEAIKQQKYLSARAETDHKSFEQLDQVLKEGEQIAQQIPANQAMFNRFYYDYLYALSYRGRKQQLLSILGQVPLPPIEQMPAYTRHAIADTYLANKQPAEAEMIYRTLLTEKNYPDINLYTSLYYSLIEQEKYQDANALIRLTDELLPTYEYSEAKGVDKNVHPDRNEYLSLLALNMAYNNRLDLSEQYLNATVAKAPNNAQFLNDLAKIQRWRDNPRQAQLSIDRLNGLEPRSKYTRINAMQNTQALGDIQAWRKQTKDLVEDYPNDSSVIKSSQELDDRNHAMITHESRFSRSRSEQNQLLQSLKGARDRESNTSLYSPWIADNYRLFIEHQNIWGKYADGNLQEQRFGLGLHWQDKGKNLALVASQNTEGQRQGFRADWSHQLNDNWQYALSLNTQANIPLQAINQGENGESYSASIQWQQNESRQANAGYGYTDISDGNKRHDFFANYNQRIFQTAHHTTQAGFSAFLGKNRLDNVAYFSPKQSYSLAVNLNHDWLTWRNYERHFNQNFSINAGLFQQQDYGSKPIFDAQYRHEWQLSRIWALHYGIGWKRHPYDGINENQTYALFGFGGRF
ncbi:poly-beta-1,6 N-acetyl-D-glucosamine export porin PgaA [Acinetobacter colistiniresistens]|uniref:Poly-beta-1,6 N-acetyl-D-glucosamine export porin PgaA n=2 Tax=Acinetobacter colistiniresistens TaxID=280145 RepID=S3TIX1_9GAMM|nr:poly-beta-1,6 N-acetyl-D-glucosamine export porin PgaA [Acinetobacter colistiniresistens]EPG39654.1 poly-beta-1,6 N-acetyl-D-glucosamine export porin PgaA [Acinetobacter colistiniresistens]TVT85856.1 poly-beta-1,6 N-acetyl-D-glucosamine export porin PgaA [Acinetobacter colistiniresistens]